MIVAIDKRKKEKPPLSFFMQNIYNFLFMFDIQNLSAREIRDINYNNNI